MGEYSDIMMEDFFDTIHDYFLDKKYEHIQFNLTKCNLDARNDSGNGRIIGSSERFMQCFDNLCGEFDKTSFLKIIFVVAVINNLPFLVESVINIAKKNKKQITNIFRGEKKESRFISDAWKACSKKFQDTRDYESALSYAIDNNRIDIAVTLTEYASSDLLIILGVSESGWINGVEPDQKLKSALLGRMVCLAMRKMGADKNPPKETPSTSRVERSIDFRHLKEDDGEEFKKKVSFQQ